MLAFNPIPGIYNSYFAHCLPHTGETLRNVVRIHHPASGEWLTSVAHKPSIVGEQATSSYSFRFPELSQTI